jgi:CDGSH-type Zn-finger protein
VVPATPGVLAGRQGHSRDVSRSLSAEPDLPEDGGATITPYRDGPLIVRGDFRLVDQDGAEIDPGRDTIALCRCGKSGIKPFCDGTHKRSGFSAPSAPSRPRPAAQILREARDDRA